MSKTRYFGRTAAITGVIVNENVGRYGLSFENANWARNGSDGYVLWVDKDDVSIGEPNWGHVQPGSNVLVRKTEEDEWKAATLIRYSPQSSTPFFAADANVDEADLYPYCKLVDQVEEEGDEA